eukprot:scaffold171363_cov38-Cyclotella_meneghiniana.AAC.1
MGARRTTMCTIGQEEDDWEPIEGSPPLLSRLSRGGYRCRWQEGAYCDAIKTFPKVLDTNGTDEVYEYHTKM